MTALPTSTAGGRPPAVFVSRDWIDWRPRRDAPLYRAGLWPNRSLGRGGRRVALGIAGAGLAVPLLPAMGTPAFWGLLPFLAAALGMLWLGLQRRRYDARLTEEVAVWRDEIRVERREPNGQVRRWSADPYHVRLMLHPEAKVEQYLTLYEAGREPGRKSGREIELGAFLNPEERVELAAEIEGAIRAALRGEAI